MSDYRVIPSIEQLRQRDRVRQLEDQYGPRAIVAALRQAAASFRAGIGEGGHTHADGPMTTERAAALIVDRATSFLREASLPSLRRVVNATGVLIHTNLGRSPLPEAAFQRMREVGRSYSNLEYDLDSGRRGARHTHAEALLCRLLGVEAAVVVNNNAGAALLVLAALAAGREVVVSRGELVEIGGGFRVPDVMAQSGAVLREVGTTNKTRVDDYRRAIGDRTAMLLRVHRSNFRIEGFTEQPSLHELAALGREHGVTVAEDLGSGYVGIAGEDGEEELNGLLGGEPRVSASVAAGIDIICFSGDKLLGGPQAGIIVGRRALVDAVSSHPLMRALRVDKLAYAALEATLGEYLAGRASRTVPLLRMLRATPEEIGARAEAIRSLLEPAFRERARFEVVEGQSAVGGGTTPGLGIPTRLLAVSGLPEGVDWLDERLRRGEPPVVSRIEHDRLLLDLRTVDRQDDQILLSAVSTALTAER